MDISDVIAVLLMVAILSIVFYFTGKEHGLEEACENRGGFYVQNHCLKTEVLK